MAAIDPQNPHKSKTAAIFIFFRDENCSGFILFSK